MMYMIFEDCEDTASSMLLRKSLAGNYILFSGGNSRLLSCYRHLRRECDKEDKILIFCDLVYGNINTTRLYEMLSEKTKKDRNTYVIPIICIEYYIVKLYNRLGLFDTFSNDKDYIVNLALDFNVDGIFEFCRSNNIKSMEKFYKNVVNSSNLLCLRNKRIVSDGDEKGAFFINNCSGCDKCKRSITLCQKAEYFYTRLPIFDIVSSKHMKVLKEIGVHPVKINKKILQDDINAIYAKIIDSTFPFHMNMDIVNFDNKNEL